MSRRGWRAPAARPVLRALAIGLALSLAVTVLLRVPRFAFWAEAVGVDALLYFRGRPPDPAIVLVAIDDDAFRELGERQPIPRRYLADLGDFLLRSGARVVAFDIVLKARSDPAEDQALVAMTHRWEGVGEGRLVFGAVAVPYGAADGERYESVPPFSPDLRVLFGFSNAPLGADGRIRRMTPVLPAREGGFLPSLALAIVAAHGGHTPDRLARALEAAGHDELLLPARVGADGPLRERRLPLHGLTRGPLRIEYADPARAFALFPSGPLARIARSGVTPADDNPFRGKIVLVGSTFLESRDFFPTPFGLKPGMEIQANMVQTLLARWPVEPAPWAWDLALLMGSCVAVSLLALWLRPVWVALVALGLVGVLAAGSYAAYARAGVRLDAVPPLVGMLAYLQGTRVLARRRLRAAFGQFVEPAVVRRIARQGADLGGDLRTVSVLMSDVRGFTTLSEKLAPDIISAMMNEYFTEMVEGISAQGGIVNDFIGDGILAVFGAPADDPEHAWHAVGAALAMQDALRRLNARWAREAKGPLAMGVAVHTGEVFAGNVGSPRRKKYTVMGDTVNTVARMEGLNRDLSTEILISGATLAVVKGRVEVRDRGAVPVKGRARPVDVFELTGLGDGTRAGVGT